MNTKNKEDILKAYRKFRTYKRFISMAADLDARLAADRISKQYGRLERYRLLHSLEYLHERIENRGDSVSDYIEDLNTRDQVILFRYHAIKHGYSIEL